MLLFRQLLSGLFGVFASGCTTLSTARDVCTPAPNRTSTIDAKRLEGRYDVVFVNAKSESGRVEARGVLELLPRDSASAILYTIGRRPHPHLTEPYLGSTTVDLGAIGAFVPGSVSSTDSAAPGVVVRVWTDTNVPQVQLLFGSQGNRRDIFTLDGAYMAGDILESTAIGLRGSWLSSIGHTTPGASGYFCARRIR